MWLQQRLKGLPGLLSSSWARRVLVGLLLFLIFYWYLSSDGLLRFLSMSRESGGAAGVCLQTDLHRWVSLVDRGEGVVLTPQTKETVPFVVGNGHFLVDVDSNKLWVASSSQPGSAPVLQTDYGPIARMQVPGTRSEARGMMLWYRKGSVFSSRCILTASSHECVTIREEFVAHRSLPNVYLQRVHISNPTDRPVSIDLVSIESPSFRNSENTCFDLYNLHTSEPTEGGKLDETLSKLREGVKREMVDVLRANVEELMQEHQQAWMDLFISGVEIRKITDAHTPSSRTVNNTLYYILSTSTAPLLDQSLTAEEQERLESSLNYADHCFSGHATMHAENLWPERLTNVAQILQLVNLWNLTFQKRGCKVLVAAGTHGMMQGMVLSFGGLQFTENHLQFQADPDVLHNSYSLRGIHYNKDLINLAVLQDTEGKPFLHVSVKPQEKPVKLYACEAGCMNEPVELTSELRGHTFPVMVTQPITPLLYISTDLTHLQDLRHTMHVKAILAHEDHMAKQYPGLPFLFWFSVASLITLFHLFLFKLIYNEYCGPGAKPLFRSKV
uniref:Si:dkeyp-104h9.5 n=1 Tax=Cyprinus carpio TaxID=7962 RepID=A0A8C1MR76_CYPCA